MSTTRGSAPRPPKPNAAVSSAKRGGKPVPGPVSAPTAPVKSGPAVPDTAFAGTQGATAASALIAGSQGLKAASAPDPIAAPAKPDVEPVSPAVTVAEPAAPAAPAPAANAGDATDDGTPTAAAETAPSVAEPPVAAQTGEPVSEATTPSDDAPAPTEATEPSVTEPPSDVPVVAPEAVVANPIEPSPSPRPAPQFPRAAAARAPDAAIEAARSFAAGYGTGATHSLVKVQTTLFGFMRSESEHAVAHLTALSRVRSPSELLRLQANEFQRAADASVTCLAEVIRTFGAFAQRPPRNG